MTQYTRINLTLDLFRLDYDFVEEKERLKNGA